MTDKTIDSAVADAAQWLYLNREAVSQSWLLRTSCANIIAIAAHAKGWPSGDVIDLDASAWESIKDAAAESAWMPPEYMMNDWVSDVCALLREPRGETLTFSVELSDDLRAAFDSLTPLADNAAAQTLLARPSRWADSEPDELSALREELAAQKETVALFESEYSKQSASLTAAEQRNSDLIELLRNPSDEMVEAGNSAAIIEMERDSDLGSCGWISNADEVIAAMLELALKPTESGASA